MAALLAGAIPKISPTEAATPKEIRMDQKEITVLISASCDTSNAIDTPSKTPINPPVMLMRTDSNMNW